MLEVLEPLAKVTTAEPERLTERTLTQVVVGVQEALVLPPQQVPMSAAMEEAVLLHL